MLGNAGLMAPRQGFHLRGLKNAACAFGKICEVHERHLVMAALEEARMTPYAARPMRNRQRHDEEMGFGSTKSSCTTD
jgi:hypothetical protein